MPDFDTVIIRLRDDGESLPDEELRRAFDHLSGHNRISDPPTPFELRELRQLAQAFSEIGPESSAVPGLSPTPLQRVTSAELVRLIRKEVEEIRWHIASQRTPLFSEKNYSDEAVSWIRSAHRETVPMTGSDADEAHRLQDIGDAAACDLAEVTGESWALDNPKPDEMRFWDEDGTLRSGLWVTRRHPRLWPLAEGTWRLSVATGFPQEELVRFVLVGTLPRLSRSFVRRKRVRAPAALYARFDRPIARDEVVLTLFTPDVTRRDLDTIFATIKDQWSTGFASGAATRVGIERDDERLYEILAPRGYFEPSEGSSPRGFWKEVADEWRARGHKSGQKRLEEALRVRAVRLRKKLPDLLPISPINPDGRS